MTCFLTVTRPGDAVPGGAGKPIYNSWEICPTSGAAE